MKGVAHISFERGGLILPTLTPYQREVLVDHVEQSAQRHGSIDLDLDDRQWTIGLRNIRREVCTSCDVLPQGTLTYVVEGRTLCRRCARRVLR